jgi:hypothetical protein
LFSIACNSSGEPQIGDVSKKASFLAAQDFYPRRVS